ncbi:MAG: holo-ACP synthase [Candidatus Cloacimonetes bacterium]|nr:holo-ACP synthase [Candidatus Cloacimonadota bacterium]
MILGIGTDIIAVSRIKKAIDANPRFVEKIFTPAEIAYCSGKASPAQSYAVRFAAKEAVMKALGTGWDGIVNWQDIEVVLDTKGSPKLSFYGGALQLATSIGMHSAHVSLSHEKDYAIAYVILEG